MIDEKRISAERLRAIVESDDGLDLKSLAEIAGGDPSTFYRGANFNDTDLRGEDLRGFNLKAATFKRVRVDQHTKVDPEFTRELGLEPVVVGVPYAEVLYVALVGVGFKVSVPMDYGDLLGEAISDPLAFHKFSEKRRRSLNAREAYEDMMTRRVPGNHHFLNTAGLGRTISKSSMMPLSEHFESLQRVFPFLQAPKFVNAFGKFRPKDLPSGLREIATTQRTAKAVALLAKKQAMHLENLCYFLLLTYADEAWDFRDIRNSSPIR